MSESKDDRSTAPRGTNTRASRAKQTRDRNIAPPAPKVAPASKRKRRGESKIPPAEPTTNQKPIPTNLVVAGDDKPEVKDEWWTSEREQALALALAGNTQGGIAQALDRERHTIKRWMDDPRFEERMHEENLARFKSTRQRRTVQTVRLTDKAHDLADKMLDAAKKKPKDLGARLAARDWLNEYREQSRREDEIYGLNHQKVDVNVNGTVNHKHKGAVVNLSFKDFMMGSMARMGIDVDSEEVDEKRVDDAIIAVAEKALAEGSLLGELVDEERQERLAPMLAAGNS